MLPRQLGAGLKNPGSQCFATSVLQALAHLSPCRAILQEECAETGALKLLRDHLGVLKRGAAFGRKNLSIPPALRSVVLFPSGQQDCAELFARLLAGFDDAGETAISGLFRGTAKRLLKCGKCSTEAASRHSVDTLCAPLLPTTAGRRPDVQGSLLLSCFESDTASYECMTK